MAVFSKFITIPTSCMEYIHPWTESCSCATTMLGIHALQESFRIYFTVYMLALLMRGRIPTQQDMRRTLTGIIISTIFLGSNAFTFPLFACWLRKLIGHFNVLSVGFIPAFLASFVSILLERPSRRSLLALYVTNVATETLFRMAVWRGLVRPVPHGQVVIFTLSMTLLLYFYRSQKTKLDSIYSVLRFVVGPYEESDYTENREDLPALTGQEARRTCVTSEEMEGRPVTLCRNVMRSVRGLRRHTSCPHPFSCIYYTLQGFVKLFSLGYGLQVCVRILMQMRRLIRKPSLIAKLLVHRNAIQLGAFLGTFSGTFRLLCCILRQAMDGDSKYHTLPAGLAAGLSFAFFPDNTIALYVMWKSLQIMYNDSIRKGYLPELPGGITILYSFSTAILFHAALVEPQNLRPSYWKFLHSLSGGRVSAMDRKCLDAFGLDTSKALMEVLEKTHTRLVPFSDLM